MNDSYRPLAETLRGRDTHFPFQETQHYGAISVVSGSGEPVASFGDPRIALPLRSTAKPFQLLPLLLDGVCSRFEREGHPLEARDLTLMMSSHNGEIMHVRRVASILANADLSPRELLCGVHAPLHEQSRNALLRDGETPTALHCNCSGKHTNMLLVCQHNQWPLDTYLETQHPLQQRIRQIIAELGDTPEETIPDVLDGCSLPTLVLPIIVLARLYARLAAPRYAPALERRDVSALLERVYQAGTRHPAYIAGTGRFESQLMDNLGDRVFAKTGAAGLFAMAVAPTDRYPHGLGVAIKIADGDLDWNVRSVVATETLRQLGLIERTQCVCSSIDASGHLAIRNIRDLPVGELRPSFALDFHTGA